MANPVRIYIATHIPSPTSLQAEMVRTLSSMLEHQGYEVFVPNIPLDVSPIELEEIVKIGTRGATLVLAFFMDGGDPQIRTGMQVIIAKRDLSKAVLVVFRNHTLQTISGVGAKWERENPHRFTLVRYENIADISSVHVPSFVNNLDYKEPSEMTLREAIRQSEV